MQKLIADKQAKNDYIIETHRMIAHDIRGPVAKMFQYFRQHGISAPSINKELHRMESLAKRIMGHIKPVASSPLNLKLALLSIQKHYVTLYPDYKFTLVFEPMERYFAKIDEENFERILANLLDNAMCLPSVRKEIRIVMKSIDHSIIIEIQDFGPGIPSNVQEKLFSGKVVSNKKDGHGIGLMSVYNLIRQINGEISFLTGSSGTTFVITMKAVQGICTDIDRLAINSKHQLIVVDDDELMHNFWREQDVNIISIFTAEEFEALLPSLELADTLILMDNDLRSRWTGLELIRRYCLESYCILVTFGAQNIRNQANHADLRIIDKKYLEFVAIEFFSEQKSQKTCVVYLDDDEFYLDNFKTICSHLSDRLDVYQHPFLFNVEGYHKDSFFFLDEVYDSCNIRGSDIALALFQKGYRNVYLRSSMLIEKSYYFRECIDKADFNRVQEILKNVLFV